MCVLVEGMSGISTERKVFMPSPGKGFQKELLEGGLNSFKMERRSKLLKDQNIHLYSSIQRGFYIRKCCAVL